MRAFLWTIIACTSATICLAQDKASSTAVAKADDPQAAFKRLKRFFGDNSLDFRTSFVGVSSTRPLRGTVDFLIKRPNLFRIEGRLGRSSYTLVSDGKVMTIYNKREQRFTEVQAPESPSQGMALLVGLASTQSHVLKLIDVLAHVAVGAQDTRVAAAGSEVVNGRPCSRFNIVENADGWYPEKWEVWLEQKDVPLPCKFRVISTDSLIRDTHTTQISWNAAPTFSDDTFRFNPPKGSKKVESVGALGLHPPTQ